MKITRILLIAGIALSLALASLPAYAEQAAVTVTVANGSICAHREIPLSDLDGDQKTTVNDALIGIHDAAFNGGSQAGYAYYRGDYGLAIAKLWGIDNDGSYSYYVNNAAAMNLDDPIKAGDTVYAFLYTDLTTWSDTYCFLTPSSAESKVGEPLTLTLTALTFDESFQTAAVPVADAALTVNGEKTAFTTDENGTVTFIPDKAGTLLLSAVSDSMILTPPVCMLSVTADASSTVWIVIAVCAAAALGIGFAALLLWRRKQKSCVG